MGFYKDLIDDIIIIKINIAIYINSMILYVALSNRSYRICNSAYRNSYI